MKIVFMGTPEFALTALKKLAVEHEIVAVYTREPKVAGRGNKIIKSPVHLWAEEQGIEVRTPKTLRVEEEQKKFAALKADVAVVAAYGLILPRPVLEAFPLGCVNIHGSLLPRWRGAAPIERALEAGDEKAGITTMKMDAGLDTGDMLLKGEVEITADMTGGELRERLAEVGADLIVRTLREWDNIVPQKQDDTLSCYAVKIEKEESLLDLGVPAAVLERKIRAFNPSPAVYFEHKGERFKILRTVFSSENVKPGEIVSRGGHLFVGCVDGTLEITEIQRQGKRVMSVAELLRGYEF